MLNHTGYVTFVLFLSGEGLVEGMCHCRVCLVWLKSSLSSVLTILCYFSQIGHGSRKGFSLTLVHILVHVPAVLPTCVCNCLSCLDFYPSEQLFIIFEFANGGRDLEHTSVSFWVNALLLKQALWQFSILSFLSLPLAGFHNQWLVPWNDLVKITLSMYWSGMPMDRRPWSWLMSSPNYLRQTVPRIQKLCPCSTREKLTTFSRTAPNTKYRRKTHLCRFGSYDQCTAIRVEYSAFMSYLSTSGCTSHQQVL